MLVTILALALVSTPPCVDPVVLSGDLEARVVSIRLGTTLSELVARLDLPLLIFDEPLLPREADGLFEAYFAVSVTTGSRTAVTGILVTFSPDWTACTIEREPDATYQVQHITQEQYDSVSPGDPLAVVQSCLCSPSSVFLSEYEETTLTYSLPYESLHRSEVPASFVFTVSGTLHHKFLLVRD